MALFVPPSLQSQAVMELVEPVPAPLIPISGFAPVVLLGNGTAMVVGFQLVPAIDGSGIEYQVSCRLIGPSEALRMMEAATAMAHPIVRRTAH